MDDENIETNAIEFPIEWHISDETPSGYATNMVVQHTEHEFVIYFFNSQAPLLVGTPEEVQAQSKQIKTVRAECIAQITVAASRMPVFLETLQRNFERWQSKSE